jgi:hypothetical protein
VGGDASGPPEEYAAAYSAHYAQRDLASALALYQRVVADHPDAREAGYSRAQIANIVSAVVPQGDLLHAQVALALAHLAGSERSS